MKKKSFRLIIGVVVIFILCGAYYGLRVYNQKTEEAEEEAAEGETILEVDSSAITAISFTIDGEQVSFSLQDDDTWQKDDDDTFPVDSTVLLTSLDELEELKSVRTLSDVEDISEYGLDEPQNTITLTDSDGEETIITIGDNNSSTGNDYLMLNEDSSVIYTVDTGLSSSFSDDLYDYAVSEEVPELQASTITGIYVETAEGESYELYLEDAIWMVRGVSEDDTDAEVTAEELADGVEADSDEADTLTTTLAALAYVDYLDHNCSDLSEYGLDEPAVTLTVVYEEEAESEDETDEEESETESETENEEESETETETEVETIELSVTFLIGNADENGDYYVRMEGSAEVHTLSESLITTLLEYSAYGLIAEPEVETETETEVEEAEADTEETETETDTKAESATETEAD
ncbi:MAG: DUF4340 domain-containing protein [Lachnospiraceae bacterium]|nr:DUF4340 domain-containing protein [Lachnospiraceae bacterium]